MNSEGISGVLRILDREVWIVTATAGDERGGLLATWVSSVAIDPQRPVMLIGLAPNHHTNQLVAASGSLALHLLAPGQIDVALNFALGSGRERDKLANFPHRPGPLGSPLLEACLGWLECQVFARLDAGDRIFYWADVVAGECQGDGPPLREQQLLAAATTAQRETLRADLQSDVRQQRPLGERWRASLPAAWRPPFC